MKLILLTLLIAYSLVLMAKNFGNKNNLPIKFIERLEDIMGPSLFREIEKTFVERPTTFRVNTIKARGEEVVEYLNSQGFKIRQIPWYKDAFVLLNKSKRELCDLGIYEEGKIYVQSLASMIPPLVLDPQPGEKVLDLTAAPGSKTSQIAALMNCQGELVANDNNKVRFFKLKHNIVCLGVVNNSFPPCRGELKGGLQIGQRPLPGLPLQGGGGWCFALRQEHGGTLCREYPEYFDKILLDAPCSAEARFIDGDPKTYGYWKEQKIKEMAYKQWGLLLSAWGALKPGGILVYSTCTFAPEENELQVTKFMERISHFPSPSQGEVQEGVWPKTTRPLPSPLLPGEGKVGVEVLDIILTQIKRLPIVKEFKSKKVNPEVVKKALRIMPTKEIEGFFVVLLKKQGIGTIRA